MTFRGALLKPSEKGERRPSSSRSFAKASRYEILKDKIRGWWEDRFKVGEYLREIRDSKLYKQEYETFEEFSEAEFEIKRTYAHRLIEAADVKDSVKMLPIGNKLENESQARALAVVPVEKREEVLTEAAKAPGPVTAKRITEAAKSNGHKEPSKAHLDKTGFPIPDSLLADYQRAEAFSSVLHQISKIKCLVEEGLKEKDFVLFAEVTNTTVATLKNAYGDLTQVIPHAVCSTCQGLERKKCTLCKGRGFLSRFKYETVVPEKTRQVRERAAQK